MSFHSARDQNVRVGLYRAEALQVMGNALRQGFRRAHGRGHFRSGASASMGNKMVGKEGSGSQHGQDKKTAAGKQMWHTLSLYMALPSGRWD